jgi:hypothetical protein
MSLQIIFSYVIMMAGLFNKTAIYIPGLLAGVEFIARPPGTEAKLITKSR